MFADAEDQAKKEREEKEKLTKPRPSAPAAPPKPAAPKADGEDEMELDEDDLKIIQDTKKQGYCYFKRTLSEKDQQLLDAEQMKLRAVSNIFRFVFLSRVGRCAGPDNELRIICMPWYQFV